MVLHDRSMYARLHQLGVVRYGYVPDALSRIIKKVLLKVWCHETVRPDLVSEWSVMQPGIGQSDVTSYYLAKHVFVGFSLVGVNLYEVKEIPYFAVWDVNGGVTCIYDFCSNWMRRAPRISSSCEPDDFFESVQTPLVGDADLEFGRRSACFAERFEAEVHALEYPARESGE